MLRSTAGRRGIGATLLLLAVIAGCGRPNVAKVKGSVTEGGQPVAKAYVKFNPQPSGRPSHARTNDQGVFTLEYIDQPGALIGTHRVEVGTGGEIDGRGNPVSRAVERLVTEVEVKGGDNDFQFELPPAARR